MRVLLILVALLAALGAAAWLFLFPTRAPLGVPDPDESQPDSGALTEPEPALPPGVRIAFTDVTASAGIEFRHADHRTEMEYLMDSTGPFAPSDNRPLRLNSWG